MTKILTINSLIFIILYAVIEIFSGNLIYKKKLSCGYLKCNFDKIYEIDLYTIKKIQINFKKNSLGFRGDEVLPEEVDVIVMGGSTTAQRYLDEEKTWVSILEKKFISNDKPFKIVNAGIDGQSTFGHIWNLKNWMPKIENLSPKYIIFFIGVNEYGDTRGFFDNNLSLSNNQNQTFNLISKLKYYIMINRGITLNIINSYLSIFHKNKLQSIGHGKINHNEIRYFNVSEDMLSNRNLNKLEENLDLIYELTKKFNSTPIFVTQRTQRWKKVNGKIMNVNDKENYFNFEKKRSDLIINFCHKKKISCINTFKKIKSDAMLTYDLVHLNPKGSRYLANVIFDDLYPIIKND